MTTGRVAVLALLAAGYGMSQEAGPVLRICLHNGPEVNAAAMKRAKSIAAGILDEVGAQTEWLNGKCQPSRVGPGRDTSVVEPLEIEVDSSENPGYAAEDALAYASPYQSHGVRIHVFFGRILVHYGSRAALVLGHVLAHEIGHVLEGVARHSPEGVLKIRFAASDVQLMAAQRLRFAPEDILMIQAHFRALPPRRCASNDGSHDVPTKAAGAHI